ncbi:NACHT domain-containing protein [Paenarthrobacter histidinolovorans]|uniref:NACHT domain-containing protein n=1 Tax=Paenarthrobacter histidinolovorans TaxID=43664 RepID=A0ABW8N0C7_9MICC
MDTVAITLGTIVAKWIFQLWAKDSAFENVGPEIMDAISRKISGRREQRRVGRQFEALADSVTERLEPYLSNEIQGADDGEIIAAARAVEETLAGALISTQMLLEHDLDQASVLAALEKKSKEPVRRNGLSEDGKAIFGLLLTETASLAISIVDELPDFTSAQAAELLSRDTKIIEVVNEVLDRLPVSSVPLSWGLGSEGQRFENKYLKAMHSYADRLQIYGVTSENAQRTYSLSVAYISMAVSSSTSSGLSSIRVSESENSDTDRKMSLDTGILDRPAEDSTPSETIRVDAALSGQRRLLISGDAGSGKTTLLQWLAASAANATFTGELSEWNGLIPFIIPLRRYANKSLPQPDSFFEQTVPPLMGVMPAGWAHRVLADGRGLVLIDGVDEIPASEREEARKWLMQLVELFPRSRFVTTSRSTALTRSWLHLPTFTQLALLPMDFADIRAFVNHWHSAAAASLARPHDSAKLWEEEKALIQIIRDRPAIRALCTSPLLCALVCALHSDRQGSLPENRMDLYSTALRMLIVRRDTERRILAAPELNLSFEESQALLRSFALWLHENGQADADFADFEKQVSKQIPLLHRIKPDAASLANFLLIRSGVLREPSPGRIDFVHRTFLEYLAAAALIDDNSIPKLIKNAHDDHWREVVILAAGHATSEARERLLTGLISRGRDTPRYKHRLWLLAISCMETSPELSTKLQASLSECLDAVIPPTNMTEARAVASAGAVAVDLLTKQKCSAKKTTAIVRTLSLIGGESAMKALEYYSPDKRVTVARELVRGWASFETEDYAKRVLANSKLDDGHLRINDPEYLQFLHHLNNLKSVDLDAAGRINDLNVLPDDINLHGLAASYAKDSTSLESLERYPSLQQIYLRNCDGLTSLRGIESLPKLSVLSLRYCSQLSDISAAESMSSLKHVDISGSPVRDVGELIASNNLEYLRIVSCAQLESLGETVECAQLDLGGNKSLLNLDAVSRSQSLKILTLHDLGKHIQGLSLPLGLKELRLFALSDLPINLSGAPSLERLSHYGNPQMDIFDFILGRPDLESVCLDLSYNMGLAAQVNLLSQHAGLYDVTIHMRSETSGEIPEIDGFMRRTHGSMTRYWRSFVVS